MASVGTTASPEILDAKSRGQWCAKARQEKRLEPGARLLLWEIADRTHHGGPKSRTPHLIGYCWASQDSLGKSIGVKKRAVSAYISQAKKLGYIGVQRRQADTALIWLTWPPGFDTHAGATLEPPSDSHAGATLEPPDASAKFASGVVANLAKGPLDTHENVSLIRTPARPILEKILLNTLEEGGEDGSQPLTRGEADRRVVGRAQEIASLAERPPAASENGLRPSVQRLIEDLKSENEPGDIRDALAETMAAPWWPTLSDHEQATIQRVGKRRIAELR